MSAIVATVKEAANGITDDLWSEAGWLKCTLTVDLRLRRFTVRDLLQLEAGAIVETENVNGADVPVQVNTRLIAWAEFEVVAQRIAVRLTELA
jgi:flagellar motor switch/type III secretory pathway protein FliN